ncbi:MAG: GNAT family N-acetyltransferase [Bacilli bacterium]|nr:GNAT family N-acetyltransferase [Bacilli bacterium]
MKLKPLTNEEYEKYVLKAIDNYRNEIMKSGIANEEQAGQQAEATFKRLLPDGINTKDNYLCYAYDQNKLVGFIWYAIRNDGAFIYDFYIAESMRRQGYGKKVILACEKDVKEKGENTIGLHVFGHNKPARALYESLDYYPTSIQMKKDLK